MVSFKKALLLAVAASVQASPLAPVSSTSESPVVQKTTIVVSAEDLSMGWTPPEIPEGGIDISNNTELLRKYGLDVANGDFSPNPAAEGEMGLMGSEACSQGECPSYGKNFDMVFTFFVISQPGAGGAPPIPLFTFSNDIRVVDCGKCYRKKVGSTSGGCYDFNSCGRPQGICVDPGKKRAHRVWKDKNVKTCYKMNGKPLGDCGFIKDRTIWSPAQEVPCNW